MTERGKEAQRPSRTLDLDHSLAFSWTRTTHSLFRNSPSPSTSSQPQTHPSTRDETSLKDVTRRSSRRSRGEGTGRRGETLSLHSPVARSP